MQRLVLGVVLVLGVATVAPRGDRAASAVSIVVHENHLDLKRGDVVVASYQLDPSLPKPFLHPVLGPNGEKLTETRPLDHLHHRSVWFCHGDVIPEGWELPKSDKHVAGYDFWAEGPTRGRIVCTAVGKPEGDGQHAWIRTVNEWRTPQGRPVLQEERILHLHGGFDPGWLFVWDITLTASEAPLTFGDTKEGSFAMRVAASMTEKKTGRLTLADGKRTEKECWGQQSDWCDYSGTVDGQAVGLTIFDDPRNVVRAAWHARAYGLCGANPFGRTRSGFPAVKGNNDLVKLAKGESLSLRYGLLVHPGDVVSGRVAENYAAFCKLARNGK